MITINLIQMRRMRTKINSFDLSLKHFFLISFLGICLFGKSQDIYKYAITFTNKGENNPYSIKNPNQFLSPRSIKRKKKMGIPITDEDLPVNPNYILEITKLIPSARVINKSRWFNHIIIQTADTNWKSPTHLPNFVSELKLIYSGKTPKSTNNRAFTPSKTGDVFSKKISKSLSYDKSDFQIKSLNLQGLHKKGFLGKDIHVAILDGGFSNVDKIEAFHHLRTKNRILGTWDFASNEHEVYGDGEHGTMVLGCMAGFVENKFLGTAPMASYWLFRTEDGATETITEEYNWISAAEFADSAGVDIINSSLGYTTFDKGIGSYSYKDMNGKTAIISRGADKAVEKGILVVNSAGNSGNDKWKYIGAPADAEKVFSIGAITKTKERARFSSFGPTSDGRIKPNVCALGYNSAVINSAGTVTEASGTSFSGPIMCGAIACLMNKHRFTQPEKLMTAIQLSGSNAENPANDLGYGIPDFLKASQIVSGKK
jgi:serine protease AprX